MNLSEALDALEAIAPTKYAESWDNVGLLVGDRQQEISSALLTIDYTDEVADEAIASRCDLIVSYHPPIFGGLKRILAGGSSNLIYDAIRRRVAIYSPHTALDIAPGGTNDMLADAIGMTERQPLKLVETKTTQCKLVTFVPEKEVEKVSKALFEAGAGRIGKYSSCSFLTNGTGTFFGEEGTDPAVGQSGRLEHVQEVRLETVIPICSMSSIVRALRQSHPYEEPAYDLNVLAAPPEGLGMGRLGTLPSTNREALFMRIKEALEIDHLLVAGPTTGNVTRAAVCAGSCGDLLDEAISQKVDLYLTGEMRHHDAIKAARAGITVVCCLHSNSERAVLKRLADHLARLLPALKVSISQRDRDPFAIH